MSSSTKERTVEIFVDESKRTDEPAEKENYGSVTSKRPTESTDSCHYSIEEEDEYVLTDFLALDCIAFLEEQEEDLAFLEEHEPEPEQVVRAKKLRNKRMKALLLKFYEIEGDMPLGRFIKDVACCWSNKNAIYNHWNKSGLALLKLAGEPVDEAAKKYDEFCEEMRRQISKRNKENATNRKALPLELEEFMSGLIKKLALCGQGMGEKVVWRIFNEALSTRAGRKTVSRSTVNRFIQKYELECKNVKNIDPIRISQITPKNQDIFFFGLDAVVSLINLIDARNCPWTCWADVPAANKFNIDKMG